MNIGVSPHLIDQAVSLNWNAIEVLVSGITGFIMILGLFTTWYNNFRENKRANSEFFLNQAIKYFSTAVSLLQEAKHNNIKWHQAIEQLKAADLLLRSVTENSHQVIFVTEYFDTAFRIVDILKDIKDFRYFYGVSYFLSKPSAVLFQECSSSFLENPRRAIDPDALICLCALIDKANKIFSGLNFQQETHQQIFREEYFQMPLKDKAQNTLGESSGISVVLDYINDYKKHKKDSKPTFVTRTKELQH